MKIREILIELYKLILIVFKELDLEKYDITSVYEECVKTLDFINSVDVISYKTVNPVTGKLFKEQYLIDTEKLNNLNLLKESIINEDYEKSIVYRNLINTK